MSFAHIAMRDPNLAFVLVQPMRAQLPPSARQNARGGRCLNNCTKGGKYALHDTLQNALVKALNGDNIKAVVTEAHPYSHRHFDFLCRNAG